MHQTKKKVMVFSWAVRDWLILHKFIKCLPQKKKCTA